MPQHGFIITSHSKLCNLQPILRVASCSTKNKAEIVAYYNKKKNSIKSLFCNFHLHFRNIIYWQLFKCHGVGGHQVLRHSMSHFTPEQLTAQTMFAFVQCNFAKLQYTLHTFEREYTNVDQAQNHTHTHTEAPYMFVLLLYNISVCAFVRSICNLQFYYYCSCQMSCCFFIEYNFCIILVFFCFCFTAAF